MKGTRLSLGFVLGIVAAAASYFAISPLCPFQNAHTHWIQIDPKGNIVDPDENEAYISLGHKQQIRWETTDGSPLLIEFDTAELQSKLGGKDPFDNMVPGSAPNFRRVTCVSDHCLSSNINTALNPGTFNCFKVKYYQQAGNNRTDGWIIIKP